MQQLLDFFMPLAAAVITGIGSSWLTVRVMLARHDERIKSIKESLSGIGGTIEIVRNVASAAHARIDNLLASRPSGD